MIRYRNKAGVTAPEVLQPQEAPVRPFTLPAIGLLLLVLAAPGRAQEQAADQQEDPSNHPSFTPYDVPPKLKNSKNIARLMQSAYPQELRGQCNRPRCSREEGPSGSVVLWLYIDEQGVVQKTAVQKSSGYEEMDEAGIGVADQMKFSPAKYQNENAAVWFTQAITFQTG